MADDTKTKTGTRYVVLAKTDAGLWEEIGLVRAASEAAAKRAALAQNRPAGAEVVAVPARSWKPEDLKPKLSFA